jgi:curved DNA-binding protein CbpA
MLSTILEKSFPYAKFITSLVGYTEGDIDDFLTPHIEFHYRTLNIKENSTEDEIKKSYRGLMILYHPDKNNGNSHEIASLINNSYNVLSDKNQKLLYDNKLKDLRSLAHLAIVVSILFNLCGLLIKCGLFIYLPYKIIRWLY